MIELNVAIEEAGNMLEKYGYNNNNQTIGAIVNLASAIIIARAIDELVATMKGNAEEVMGEVEAIVKEEFDGKSNSRY